MAEMPLWIRIEGEQIWLNTASTAEFFGVSRMALSDWARKGCPKAGRGWWDIKAVMEWLGRSPGSEGQGEISLEARKLAADAEYRESKAAREKIALAALTETLIHKEEVAAEWSRRVLELRSSLLALSRKLAGHFPDPAVRSVVEGVISDEIYDYLEQYTRTGRYTPKAAKKPAKKA